MNLLKHPGLIALSSFALMFAGAFAVKNAYASNLLLFGGLVILIAAMAKIDAFD